MKIKMSYGMWMSYENKMSYGMWVSYENKNELWK